MARRIATLLTTPSPFKRARAAQSAASRRASRALHADRGPDAQDDGRRCPLRHRQGGAAQWLLLRRQDGHAQKIDPVTHLYSKTMHIASFAGIAPVNNPVIAIAVIIDSPPKAALLWKASPRPCLPRWPPAGAEYLGVSARHRSAPCARRRQESRPRVEDDAGAQTATSRPLCRGQRSAQRRSAAPGISPALSQPAAQPAKQAANPAPDTKQPSPAENRLPLQHSRLRHPDRGQPPSWLPSLKNFSPSLIGLPVRKVIETGSRSGLGSANHRQRTVREQAPARAQWSRRNADSCPLRR